MRDLKLINEYRILDRDLASFFYKLHGGYQNESKLFIPDINNKGDLELELNSLQDRVNNIEKPDDVFDLVQGHFTDFVKAQKVSLENTYERPYRHIGVFLHKFSHLTRKDSRPDVEKAEILVEIYRQADDIWKGILTWIDRVPFLYLQELIDTCQLFIDTMEVEIPRIPDYFPNLNGGQEREVVDAIETLSEKMSEWIKFVKGLMEEKGMSATDSTTEEDIIKFEESYYRALLGDVIGVNLDEILSWHEEEIEKTRNEVFEIASKLKIPDPTPKSMKEVNDILLKYAGPCNSPEEMFERANEYIKRAQAGCKGYVWLPEGDSCLVKRVPEYLKTSYPWGGYGGGCTRRRPLQGEMFLNNYNYKAVTDGWIKMNTIHEAYPGHHVQFVRTTIDPIPETVKIGAKSVPITEGTAHRSERVFEFVFEEDQFYPLFVAYRRHHTSVRIKADLMLRYFGRPIGDAVQLYVDELGFDRATARGQVKAQEGQQGYFTTYYYGMKKLCDWEKEYGYDEKTYTELLFSAGRVSLETFEKFLKLSEQDKHSFLHDFASMFQFR
ncbi:MAG: DUF885 domain-containing protein [Tissierellia bacterium]|nr:DUF885 domain-containing protein [Tissierellia bacterium]